MRKSFRGLILATAWTCLLCAQSDDARAQECQPSRSEKIGCQVLPADMPEDSKTLGIALAGGGTKAAAYSMGVLTGASEENALSRIGAISSVSGGSYAGFFLYSKLILDAAPHASVNERAEAYFRDCLPGHYRLRMTPDLERALDQKGRFCGPVDLPDEAAPADFRFQQFVRCRQDVLEGDCNFESSGADKSEYVHIAALSGATLLSVVPNFVIRSVFDWPLNISPSRLAYRDGIGTAYGLYPLRGRAYAGNSLVAACEEGAFSNCVVSNDNIVLDRETSERALTFSRLRAAYQQYRDMPLWIPHATASRNRSIFGWAGDNRNNFDRYVFAMSPYQQCSGQFGAIELEDKEGFDLLDAVNVSAAFFDANEKSVRQPQRFLVAVVQHLANLDWGLDVDNPQVSNPLRRPIHEALPFPFYFLDGLAVRTSGARDNQQSSFVRLHDGGNSDDLGAYTLIRGGFKTVLISDHSYDREGEMLDLCDLVNELKLRDQPLHVRMPALGDLDTVCRRFADRSELPEAGSEQCREAESRQTQGNRSTSEQTSLPVVRYPIQSWRYPFLAGCIVDQESEKSCGNGWLTRLLLIKPAFDVQRFRSQQIDENGLIGQCDGQGIDAELPCETAAYVHSAMGYHGRGKDGSLPVDQPEQPRSFAFPQHTTPGMTLDSSAVLYGAYKDLARSRTRMALTAAFESDEQFKARIEEQAAKPLLTVSDLASSGGR